MPKHQNDTDRFQTPVDIAAKMFGEQQDSVLRAIKGPPARTPNTPPPDEAVIIAQEGLEDIIVPMIGRGK